ncbi:hypothetical protein [uncultured Dysosmobacter sp.]|nr:hypothetical protein [uncultured Dysosmobacter sp.]
MQSIEITGLKELTAALDAAPGVIREGQAAGWQRPGQSALKMLFCKA